MREKLVEARVARGLSQAQVAEALGVSIVSVSRWENGKVTPRQAQVKSLCDVYHSTPQMLGLAHFSLLEQHKADMTQHLSQALQQDLTGKLFKLVWSWTGQHYGDLQSQISAHIASYHQVSGSSAMTRRAALRSMILLPLELCLAMPTAKNVATEEILAQCAAGITAAWHEALQGYDLQTPHDAMNIYLPALQAIAQKASPKQRAAAAELVMQCYLIKGTMVRHLEGNEQAIKQLQMALPYSDLAASNEQKILTLRTIAATYNFAHRQDRAISFGEQAAAEMKTGRSQLQSFVYAGLANYQSSQGKKSEALKFLDKAYSTFFRGDRHVWVHHPG